jgi:hypothetical protein
LEYAVWLRRVSHVLKEAAPGVRVMSAGVVWPSNGMFPEPYFTAMLSVPGLRDAVDIFAIHPYGNEVYNVMDLVRSARSTLNSNGASGKPMWITEVGWATGNYDGLIVPEWLQANHVDELYGQLLANRRRYRLLGAVWYTYRDRYPRPGEAPTYAHYWGNNTGLRRTDSSAKPSWLVFSRRARSGY